MPIPSRTPAAALAAALLAALAAAPASAQSPRSPNQPASMEAHIATAEREDAFRGAVNAFVAAAVAGDTARVEAMISPRMRERAGGEAVRRVVGAQVLPFFADFAELGKSVTIAGTTDQFGSAGFVYYLYAVSRRAERRPWVLYVVEEGGRPVVANVLVGRFVEGRHQ